MAGGGGGTGHPEETEEWDLAIPGVSGGKSTAGRGEKLRTRAEIWSLRRGLDAGAGSGGLEK